MKPTVEILRRRCSAHAFVCRARSLQSCMVVAGFTRAASVGWSVLSVTIASNDMTMLKFRITTSSLYLSSRRVWLPRPWQPRGAVVLGLDGEVEAALASPLIRGAQCCPSALCATIASPRLVGSGKAIRYANGDYEDLALSIGPLFFVWIAQRG